MANHYTEHYQLCQWAPEDTFNREEFNQDNAKIDAALAGKAEESALNSLSGAVGRLGHRVEDLQYNVYDLTLRDYYEGKDTGSARALLFDGFRDTAGVASGGALVFQPGQAVLSGKGQGNITLAYAPTGAARNLSTPNQNITGTGVFTGFQLQVKPSGTQGLNFYFDYRLFYNGAQVAAQRIKDSIPVSYESALRNYSLPASIHVAEGDTISLSVDMENYWVVSRWGENNNTKLGCVFRITPRSGQSARLVSVARPLPAAAGALAWVRHSGGTVGLSLRTGGTDRPMTPAGQRQTVNAQGTACTESAFRLAEELTEGETAAVLDLSLNGAAKAALFDYGVALLA